MVPRPYGFSAVFRRFVICLSTAKLHRLWDERKRPHCYTFAQDYKAISYFQFDPGGAAPVTLIYAIKPWLPAGLPSRFGLTAYSSYGPANTTSKFPYPTRNEQVVADHAIMVMGDGTTIKNTNRGGIETVGALLMRNPEAQVGVPRITAGCPGCACAPPIHA